MKAEAQTLADLKQKVRKKMKWTENRRNWTTEEQAEFDAKYEFAIDYRKSVFYVKEKEHV